ncbi:MAG: cobalt-precorrin 5A hydrolase [Oscillospiraceae bacterium]|nr:cobalt-precorrin 5A hydrolase [Oscillospiraceae bacterium]
MRTAIFAFSRRGCTAAGRIRDVLGGECRCYTMEKYCTKGFAPIAPPLTDFTGPVFAWADALVFVGACGIAVRAVAPHLRDKRTDPAVVVVDELEKFVISLLSGHIGGANNLAERLAAALGSVPVVTTATDVSGRFAVDAWAVKRGLHIVSKEAAKAVSAAVLEDSVPLCTDFPIAGDLPAGVEMGGMGDVGICISWKNQSPFRKTLLLAPPVLHLGIGCRRGTNVEAIASLVERVLEEAGALPEAVKVVASIDLKQDEPGLLEFCRQRKWPVSFYSAKELSDVEGEFTPSRFVQKTTGVDNVCERAALLGAERLLVKKIAKDGVTVALAVESWEVCFDG